MCSVEGSPGMDQAMTGTTVFALPDQPLARFKEVYDALYEQRGWFEDPSILRFAAIAAVTSKGDAGTVARELRAIADNLKEQSGWFGELNSNLRFIVAAMLLSYDDRAADFLAEVERVREMFREIKLRRGSSYEVMAILILRIGAGKQPISLTTVKRFQSLYEEMKRHHWWLTGPEDFPACAILANQEGAPRAIGERVEAIYQALNREFSAGDPLQTAANILYLAPGQPAQIAQRYGQLANGFREKKVSIWQSDYDELAILTFLAHRPAHIVSTVLRYREDIAAFRPTPNRSMTFNLAASVAFLDMVRQDIDLKSISDARALMNVQAIIQAQQAAACVAAATAASAAAASSG